MVVGGDLCTLSSIVKLEWFGKSCDVGQGISQTECDLELSLGLS